MPWVGNPTAGRPNVRCFSFRATTTPAEDMPGTWFGHWCHGPWRPGIQNSLIEAPEFPAVTASRFDTGRLPSSVSIRARTSRPDAEGVRLLFRARAETVAEAACRRRVPGNHQRPHPQSTNPETVAKIAGLPGNGRGTRFEKCDLNKSSGRKGHDDDNHRRPAGQIAGYGKVQKRLKVPGTNRAPLFLTMIVNIIYCTHRIMDFVKRKSVRKSI